MLQKEYPEARMNIVNAEEKYDEYLTSENALLKMLGILAGVCTLLSIFAIYSLVSLTCEQRRKEIAIRKVNGADIKHILSMFTKEYASLLMIAAVLSFSIGYYIMKQWVENYTLQTNIDWWVFASILMGIAMIITLCIGQRIWKAANENPADVVKSE
jgi:ABC-type antimicrobial peptide transport system permease subunit